MSDKKTLKNKKEEKKENNKETLFKNKVGRPSNEIKEKRRKFYVLITVIVLILIFISIYLIRNNFRFTFLRAAVPTSSDITFTVKPMIEASSNGISYVDSYNDFSDDFVINNPNGKTYYYNWFTYLDSNLNKLSTYRRDENKRCYAVTAKTLNIGKLSLTVSSKYPGRSGTLKVYKNQNDCLNDVNSSKKTYLVQKTMRYEYKSITSRAESSDISINVISAVNPSSNEISYVDYGTYNDTFNINNPNGKTYFYNWFTYSDSSLNKLSTYRRESSCKIIQERNISIYPLGVTVSSKYPKRSGKLRIYSSQMDCIKDRDSSKNSSAILEKSMRYEYSPTTTVYTTKNYNTTASSTTKNYNTTASSTTSKTTTKTTTKSTTKITTLSKSSITRTSVDAKQFNNNSNYKYSKQSGRDWNEFCNNMTKNRNGVTYLDYIEKYSKKFNVDADLLMAIIANETLARGNNLTGITLNNKSHYGYSLSEINNSPEASISVSAQMVKENLAEDKTLNKALCHYGGFGRIESCSYVNVMNEYRSIIKKLFNFGTTTTTKTTTTKKNSSTKKVSIGNVSIDVDYVVKPDSDGVSYIDEYKEYLNHFDIVNNDSVSHYYKWFAYKSFDMSESNMTDKKWYTPTCKLVKANSSVKKENSGLTVSRTYPNRAGQIKIYENKDYCEKDTGGSLSAGVLKTSIIKYSYKDEFKYITDDINSLVSNISKNQGTQKYNYSSLAAYSYGAYILTNTPLKLNDTSASFKDYGASNYDYSDEKVLYKNIKEKIDNHIPVVITVSEPSVNTYDTNTQYVLVVGYNSLKKPDKWTFDDVYAIDPFNNSKWENKDVTLRSGSLSSLGIKALNKYYGYTTWDSANVKVTDKVKLSTASVKEPTTPSSVDNPYVSNSSKEISNNQNIVQVVDVKTVNKERKDDETTTYNVIKSFYEDRNIAKISTYIGSQLSSKCYSATLAYGVYILTGKVSGACGDSINYGADDGQSYNTYNTKKSELQNKIFTKINEGIPVSIHVRTEYGQHWVLVVGYNANKDVNDFELDDYYIIDPYYSDSYPKVGTNILLYSGPTFKNYGGSAFSGIKRIRSTVISEYDDYGWSTWTNKNKAVPYNGC